MLECKEHHGLPLYMYPLPQTTPGREEVRTSMFSQWAPSMPVPLSVPKTSCHSHLAPNCLARHPNTWSKDEVRVWLEWCAGEYSIEPVAHDKFDMNGKALELLNRADFMERDPLTGDVLFNALQRLMTKNENSSPCAYQYAIGSPAGVPNSPFNHHTQCPPLKPPPDHGNGIILFTGSPPSSIAQPPYTTEKHQPTYVPIRPGPLINHPSPLQLSKDLSPKIHIPESMLSPAPTTDTDSGAETEVLPDGEDVMDYAEDTGSRLHQHHHSPEAGLTPTVLPDVPHIKRTDGDCRLLWEFIHQLLQETRYRDYVCWERQEELIFRIVNPTGLAELWGYQKNRTNMTYEKLSRALRYYYKMNIIKKVSGKRLTYQFLQHPRNIKKGQRGARPHSARLIKQETNPSPQPITEDHHNEVNSPPIRDFHPEEHIVNHKPLIGHHPVHNQHVDSFDNYDNQCDLQLIDGRLRPPLEEEGQEDHTVPHVKQEVPVQEEPEDLSMKPSSARRLSEDVDYAHVKEEHPDEDSHIKLENSS